MRALHNQSFTPPWSVAQWNWRFHRDLDSEVSLTGAFASDGSCLALHGGRAHRIVLDGRAGLGMSHSDVAVDANLRRGLGGSRHIVRIGREFIATHCRDSCSLMWGFPQPPLRRVLTRFLGGQVYCDITFSIHELGQELSAPAAVDVRDVACYGPDIDALWQRCREDIGTGVIRDRRYLNWRFAMHPGVDYTLLEARDRTSGALRGICVLRAGGWDDAITSIMEWLVPLADGEAERALLSRSVNMARMAGYRCVAAWFPTSSLQFHRLQVDHAFIAHSTPYQQLFTSWVPGVDREWLQQNWYQTMGDIDFF